MTTSQPTGAVLLPDGAWVHGRGLRRPRGAGRAPEYGLYLGSRRMRARYDDELQWPHEWIEWPDFLLPRDRAAAVEQIHLLHAAAMGGQRVEVACGGGVGRTGTVIACLAVIAGVPSEQAVHWTRAHYDRRAVETPWQRRWVAKFR